MRRAAANRRSIGWRQADRDNHRARRTAAAATEAIPAVGEPIVELDVLIHNAGVAYPGRVAEASVDEWRATMGVNVIGAVALTLAVLPALRTAGGHVVFINSG